MALLSSAGRVPLLLLALLAANGVCADELGALAPDEPVQTESTSVAPFSVEHYQVTPAAQFSVKALVLSTEKYSTGREAELSPVDLALGWGPMSDSAVLSRLHIRQGERRYYYQWPDSPPISPADIIAHSTNMHVIPANEAVRRVVDAIQPGQVVELKGYLVRVEGTGGWQWNSSLTRADTGDGACELMWVREIAVR